MKLTGALLLSSLAASTDAFAPASRKLFVSSLSSTTVDTEFNAFAESLTEEEIENSSSSGDETSALAWQESLEKLLDPNTPLAKRQILLNDLLGANQEIRESVQEALRDRKIDPLLTPTGKKLQDGTVAVARQIRTDILPSIASAVQKPPQEQLPTLQKVGSRFFDVVSSQAKKNIDLLKEDLANPRRIPERINKQTQELATEARNVFLEKPEGLVEPPYTVVSTGQGYEIRDYPSYTVASTVMSTADMIGEEEFKLNDVASGGFAFNNLASYLFGENEEKKSMDMTTPVTMTHTGEMRFYLAGSSGRPMTPKRGSKVEVIEIPASRLAVAKFTGFVTEGEVNRQKDALLSSLAIDGVEVDVPHGAVVPHLIFQYNPPYTIPILRRNEIAVPVRTDVEEHTLESEWESDFNEVEMVEPKEVESPSDVE